uniref:Alternative protein WDFY1 n=1 Tax=Homo sapiens TaxID=9606 RepID=L8E905_HUMAN|nr:alternative protein WDFY1 [Homo sapiens]
MKVVSPASGGTLFSGYSSQEHLTTASSCGTSEEGKAGRCYFRAIMTRCSRCATFSSPGSSSPVPRTAELQCGTWMLAEKRLLSGWKVILVRNVSSHFSGT